MGPVFDEMVATSLESTARRGMVCDKPVISTEECVDVWPIVAARDYFYGPRQFVTMDNADPDGFSPTVAEVGDVISAAFISSGEIGASLRMAFCTEESDAPYVKIHGVVSSIFTVRSLKRKDDRTVGLCDPSSLNPRDREVAETFGL